MKKNSSINISPYLVLQRKIMKIKYFIRGILVIMNLLILYISCISYSKILNESYKRLESYYVKIFNTEYGIMSYVDRGSSERDCIY